jgi:hypothetical protein
VSVSLERHCRNQASLSLVNAARLAAGGVDGIIAADLATFTKLWLGYCRLGASPIPAFVPSGAEPNAIELETPKFA